MYVRGIGTLVGLKGWRSAHDAHKLSLAHPTDLTARDSFPVVAVQWSISRRSFSDFVHTYPGSAHTC